jgi:hypothetical protein
LFPGSHRAHDTVQSHSYLSPIIDHRDRPGKRNRPGVEVDLIRIVTAAMVSGSRRARMGV